jgi:quercetin dioxygenase-like cupin family protein
MTIRSLGAAILVLPALLLLFAWHMASGQEAPTMSTSGRNMAEMTFGPVPGLPSIAVAAVESGDPRTGPSIILAKVPKGCVIPWHWHTPGEHVMIVSGTAVMEMKDGKPATLRPGGFVLMPAHHIHQFRGVTNCVLFVYSDAAFDIHYVNAAGNEISADEALKAVGETPAK